MNNENVVNDLGGFAKDLASRAIAYAEKKRGITYTNKKQVIEIFDKRFCEFMAQLMIDLENEPEQPSESITIDEFNDRAGLALKDEFNAAVTFENDHTIAVTFLSGEIFIITVNKAYPK
jgi:hypothetical protein